MEKGLMFLAAGIILIVFATQISVDEAPKEFKKQAGEFYCYQEQVDDPSTGDGNCDLVRSGYLQVIDPWSGPSGENGGWDTSWTTYSTASNTAAITLTYMKPPYASEGSIWKIKCGGVTYNHVLPANCFNRYADKVSVRVQYISGTNLEMRCDAGTWEPLGECFDGDLHEEAMNWYIDPDGATTCTCDVWHADGCGTNGCAADTMGYSRECTPTLCDVQVQCLPDASCETPITTCDGCVSDLDFPVYVMKWKTQEGC